MESLKTKIKLAVYERAPNSLTLDNLHGLLPEIDISSIKKEIEALVNEGFLIERKSGRNTDYQLPSYENLPVKEYISIGDLKVPRMLANDTARPESVNIFYETLAKRILIAEVNAEKKFEEKLKSYWGNVITLFGAFIGVFSLIVGFLKTIPITENATFSSVFWLSTAQVIPFAIVLVFFVAILKWLFK
jgi:hypothetical protein